MERLRLSAKLAKKRMEDEVLEPVEPTEPIAEPTEDEVE